MQYLLVIDAESALGMTLLRFKNKVGGASFTWECGATAHPVIVCTALDWATAPGFVVATHLHNPPNLDSARQLIAPTRHILFATEHRPEEALAAAQTVGPAQ